MIELVALKFGYRLFFSAWPVPRGSNMSVFLQSSVSDVAASPVRTVVETQCFCNAGHTFTRILAFLSSVAAHPCMVHISARVSTTAPHACVWHAIGGISDH